MVLPQVMGFGPLGTAAYAQTVGGGGTGASHSPGTSGQSMGQGGSTGTKGHYGQGGSTGTETGDEGTSLDKQGPRFGGGANSSKPQEGTTGGRPAWAKEGIPAVELGRLSVARSPEHVLDHAFTEVVGNWATLGTTVMVLSAEGQETITMTVAQLYSLPANEFAQIVQTYYSSIVRVDSPLENLSLLKSYTLTGTMPLTGVTPASQDDMIAIFLGSASDKTIPVSTDTVTAVNTILGLPALTPEQTADIAAKAEAVRLAIDTGHG
ncbi:MAG: hypothetical protein B7X08_03205 [Acidocella sp. 20-63-7]|nr:MAG: hypothetical protein B7X08_03205 [Acidocella sp. 20-63-7]